MLSLLPVAAIHCGVSTFTQQLHAAASWPLSCPADQQEVDELEQAMAQLTEAGSPGNDEEGQGDLLDDFVLSATQVCLQSFSQDSSAGTATVEAHCRKFTPHCTVSPTAPLIQFLLQTCAVADQGGTASHPSLRAQPLTHSASLLQAEAESQQQATQSSQPAALQTGHARGASQEAWGSDAEVSTDDEGSAEQLSSDEAGRGRRGSEAGPGSVSGSVSGSEAGSKGRRVGSIASTYWRPAREDRKEALSVIDER